MGDGHKEVQKSLIKVTEGLEDIIGETKGLDNHLENVVDRMTDIINEHDQKPGVASHGSVQIGLGEVIKQVENAIDIHEKENEEKEKEKERKKKKEPEVPELLESVVDQVEVIMKQRKKDQPKKVQESLVKVVKQIEDVIVSNEDNQHQK